jgi:hypothetical protein
LHIHRPVAGHCPLVLELVGGALVYAMGINVQHDLAIARRLIERQIPVDPTELADPSKPLTAMLNARA